PPPCKTLRQPPEPAAPCRARSRWPRSARAGRWRRTGQLGRPARGSWPGVRRRASVADAIPCPCTHRQPSRPAPASAHRRPRRRVASVTRALRNLDDGRAAVLETLCETIVPGSGRVGPVVYIDALISAMSEPEREAVKQSIDALTEVAPKGPDALKPHAFTPAFLQIRA